MSGISVLSEYQRGAWKMFEIISSFAYGKDCYFLQDIDVIPPQSQKLLPEKHLPLVYSRISGKYITMNQALREFLNYMDGDYGK